MSGNTINEEGHVNRPQKSKSVKNDDSRRDYKTLCIIKIVNTLSSKTQYKSA